MTCAWRCVMLDGIELKGRCCVVALGIDTDGVKHPLGLWDGSTENATVATTLLANLVERGLDVEQGVLVVIDGAKALRKAVRDVFGVHTPVQRCVRHKERNVLDHLPERDRATPSAGGCARRGRSTTTTARSTGCARSPTSSPAPTPAPPRRCARAGGDAHRHPPRRPRPAQAHARLDEPVRVDDRDRPPHQPQRQALAERRHVPALDRRRHARSRDTSSAASSATATSPSSPSPSSATSPPSAPPTPRPRPRSHADHDRGAGGRRFTRLR